jgi:hypothetical protein
MLKEILNFVFGALILWWGGFGLWSGFKYGAFRGGPFTVRASRTEEPIMYWLMVLLHSVLTIAATLFLLMALWWMLRAGA